MHPSTFEHLKPTPEQIGQMNNVRMAAKAYCDALEAYLPEGPDKTYIIRNHRSNAMWANESITRLPATYMMEKFWLKLAWLMPKQLVYWCSIRLGANATQGEWSNVSPSELLFMDALKRWEKGTN